MLYHTIQKAQVSDPRTVMALLLIHNHFVILLFAYAFNLGQSNILLFGNESTHILLFAFMHLFVERVEQDQPVHMCRLILLYNLLCSIIYICH